MPRAGVPFRFRFPQLVKLSRTPFSGKTEAEIDMAMSICVQVRETT